MLKHEPKEDGNEYYYIHKHTARLAVLEKYIERHWTISEMLRSFFRGFIRTLKGKFKPKVLTKSIGNKEYTTTKKRKYVRVAPLSNIKKPFCKNGHDYNDPSNLRYKIARGIQIRYCNGCNRERARMRRENLKLKENNELKELQ